MAVLRKEPQVADTWPRIMDNVVSPLVNVMFYAIFTVIRPSVEIVRNRVGERERERCLMDWTK